MNGPVESPSLTPVNLAAVFRAIRFAQAAVVLVLSYLNVRASLLLPAFRSVISDMLGGKPLPALTVLVLEHPALFLVGSFLIPVGALLALLDRRMARPFYVLGGLTIFAFVHFVVLCTALTTPLRDIVSGMSNPPEVTESGGR